MTNEEAIYELETNVDYKTPAIKEACQTAIKALEQQPCEMTVNEYRNRLMDAFHNADCGELIAVVVRPEESEFKHLEWLLKNHYHNQKQQPCEDCISRQAVKRKLQEHHNLFINAYGGRVGFKSMADAKEKARVDEINNCIAMVVNEPSVTPKEKTGWIPVSDRLPEDCQRVLVTVVRYNGNNIVRVAYYYNRNNGKGIFQIQENHEQWEVGEKGLLAWMPLPEPYKVGDTDGNSNN